MKTMRIWRLTPLLTDDPMWLGSSHRAPVLVRAPDEDSARALAEKQFGVATRFPPGTSMSAAPWTRKDLVRAEIVEQTRHEADGPLELLEPSFETDLPRHPRPGAAGT
jgi:hypothetical protein